MFKAKFFSNNRAALSKGIEENAMVVLAAHSRVQRSGDTSFPFRQESNFWYLSGLTEPDYVLVVAGADEYLIAPERSATYELFEGSAKFSDISAASGITQIYSHAEGWQRLKQDLQSHTAVYTKANSQLFVPAAGLQMNGSQYRLLQRLKIRNKNIKIKDVQHLLVALRIKKQPEEITALRHAITITSDAFNELSGSDLSRRTYEHEIEAELTYSYRKHGAVHGYEPIVASGANACTLHYVQNDSLLSKDSLLLVDSGAEVSGYSADITRMFAVGKPTKRQKAIYDAVYEAQEKAFDLFRPGVSLKEIESDFCKIMAGQLKKLGLVTGGDDAAIRTYYPHALSHFLGLDVHDVGGYDTPLSPGMVMTVEPGIYIPEEGIGVRIEDDILITAGGYENLSSACQKVA